MAEYLLDANHASPLVTTGHRLRKRVLDELRNGHEFFVSVPALAEALFGISVLPRATLNRAEWVRLSRFITCIELDEQNAKLITEIEKRVTERDQRIEELKAEIEELKRKLTRTPQKDRGGDGGTKT